MRTPAVRYFVLLVTVLSLILAACDATTPTGGDGEAGDVDTAEEGDGESVQLELWHAGTPPKLQEGMEALVADFEDANPNVSVNIEVTPFAEYFQKVATALAAGAGPDVFWVDVTYVPEYANSDVVLVLDDLLPEGDVEDFYPAPRADMTYDGSVRSLPMHQSTEALAYRVDLVTELGIEPPESYAEAWTWDEFLATVTEAVEEMDSDNFWGYTTEYGPGLYTHQPWVAANGGALIDESQSTFSGYLDSPETIEAMQWWADLFSEHGVSPLDPIPDMLENGQTLLHQTNPFTLADLLERRPDLEIATAPLPCRVTCAVQTGGWHIGINANTEHPDEAWELTYAIGGPEGQKKWTEITRYIPARQSVLAESSWLEEPVWRPFVEGLEDYPIRRPVTEVYGLLDDEYLRVLSDATVGADINSEEMAAVAARLDAEHSK